MSERMIEILLKELLIENKKRTFYTIKLDNFGKLQSVCDHNLSDKLS